ncbi:thiolase family protein [Bacillus timonensis]|uniref:thiolase family protein n=1 Tax=Bacillus timonensis TaxID=1033734 RepID=UPI00028819CB
MVVNMRDVVIVEAVRTPIGKFGGSLKGIDSGTLGSIVIKEVVHRTGIDKNVIDEVILGEVRQTSESSNVARVASLRAGLPESATAFTINRLCASGMQAVASAVQQIHSNQAEILIAGGTENLSRAPYYIRNSRFGDGPTTLIDSNMENGQQPQEIYGSDLGMVKTAENVAERFSISREEQDKFALNSQVRAAQAIKDGKFKEEIVPVEVKNRKSTTLFDTDEFPRESSLEKLGTLKPVLGPKGSITAGNACGRNDGASALLLMTYEKARDLGLEPLAKIVDWATAGVSPEIMGIGPVPAVNRLLERTKMRLSDFGLIELNEAFAAQAIAVINELDLDYSKVNVNGGAIALGHPLGATGARIMTTLLYEMKRRNEQYGLATLCVGGGQGMATAIELLN